MDAEAYRILLIEDSSTDATLLLETLGSTGGSGWALRWADRLAPGLELLAHEPFDAVLLDLNLPDARGLDGLSRVVSAAPRVPVVMLTGSSDETLAAKAIQAGAEDYLVKGDARPATVRRAVRHAIERKRMEGQLVESERRYRQLMATVPDIAFTLGPDGAPRFVSPNVERVLGYAPEELVQGGAEHWQALIHPDDREAAARGLQALLRGESTADFEARFRTRDGRWRWMQARAAIAEDAGGTRLVHAIATDVTEPKASDDARRLLQRRLGAILACTGEGLYGLDLDGRITFVNPAAAAMFGRRPDELVRRVAHEEFHHHREDGAPYPREECPIYAVLHDGRSRRVERDVMYRADGSRFHVAYASAPLVEDGEVTGAVVSFEDITLRLGQQRALEQAYAQLREADAFRTQFVNNAAHELRAPMVPLKTYVYMMTREMVEPEELKKVAGSIQRQVLRLEGLVNDILDAAKLQAGKVTLKPAEVDLTALAHQVGKDYRGAAEAAGIAMVVDAEPGVVVHADPKRIEQVLANLVANALKFTPREGRVVVQLRRRESAVEVRVRDTGAGVPPDRLGVLFQPFSQAHFESAHKGSGLGLFICRGFVEQHGGAIGAESAGPRQGSTFWFTLPVRAPGAPRVDAAVEKATVDVPAATRTVAR